MIIVYSIFNWFQFQISLLEHPGQVLLTLAACVVFFFSRGCFRFSQNDPYFFSNNVSPSHATDLSGTELNTLVCGCSRVIVVVIALTSGLRWVQDRSVPWHRELPGQERRLLTGCLKYPGNAPPPRHRRPYCIFILAIKARKKFFVKK